MDKFRIISKIGHGSYGQVWLVKHKSDKKHYVLKQINLQNASQREIRAAHLEVQLLASLRHPNIVCYRDAFKSSDGLLFIAMSYCEGGDLYKKIKEQKGVYFQEIQVVEWFIQICMALQYLHDRNILHRDLKTQNIFLTRSKVIKVGDLGIAKVLDSENAMATTLIGTPYYMSPELFSNKPYNHKSDVWALGCCIYEIATLRHAFNANDINALMYKILRGKLPCMPRQYSVELVNLIRVMLNQNPEERPTVSKILKDPFVKKNIAVFLEGTQVSMRRDVACSPGRKKTEHVQLSNPNKLQQACEDIVIRRVAGKDPSTETNAPPKPSSEKNHFNNELYLKGCSIFQANKCGAGGSRSEHNSPRCAMNECLNREVVRSPRVSSSRSASSEECNEAVNVVDEVISADLIITGSEIKLEERNLENLGEQKKSPRRQNDEVTRVGLSDLSPTQQTLLPQPQRMLNKNTEESVFLNKDSDNLCQPQNVPAEPTVCCAVDKMNCHSCADVCKTVHRTKVNKPLRIKRRLSRAHKQQTTASQKDVIVLPAMPSTCPKVSELVQTSSAEPVPVDKIGEEDSVSENHKLRKKVPEGSETNRRNLSARQRRRAKLKQELHSSGENESTDADRRDSKLQKSPVVFLKKEPEQNPKSDEDLTALLTLLNITLHDDRASPKEQDLQDCTSHNPDAGTRLNSRIKLLHQDCVQGLGLNALSEALKMLNNCSSAELETKLQNLLGMAKFVEFIGKIWQLKFCQDSIEGSQDAVFQKGNL